MFVSRALPSPPPPPKKLFPPPLFLLPLPLNKEEVWVPPAALRDLPPPFGPEGDQEIRAFQQALSPTSFLPGPPSGAPMEPTDRGWGASPGRLVVLAAPWRHPTTPHAPSPAQKRASRTKRHPRGRPLTLFPFPPPPQPSTHRATTRAADARSKMCTPPRGARSHHGAAPRRPLLRRALPAARPYLLPPRPHPPPTTNYPATPLPPLLRPPLTSPRSPPTRDVVCYPHSSHDLPAARGEPPRAKDAHPPHH